MFPHRPQQNSCTSFSKLGGRCIHIKSNKGALGIDEGHPLQQTAVQLRVRNHMTQSNMSYFCFLVLTVDETRFPSSVVCSAEPPTHNAPLLCSTLVNHLVSVKIQPAVFSSWLLKGIGHAF